MTTVTNTVAARPRSELGRGRLHLRRFLRNRLAVAGVVIFTLLVLFSLLGGLFTSCTHTDADFTALTRPPSDVHWFGTNQGGNDIYASAVHGLRRSLVIAVSVSVLTIAVAAVVGAGAAYFGGRVERLTLAVIHFLLIVPSFLILALVSNRLAGDWRALILVLTLFGWMSTARVIWAVSTSLRERDYVTAAEFMGVRPPRIILRHIIPNLGSLLIVNLTLGVVTTVLSETALSFLGFGVQTPDVSLGTMLADGATTITSAPWLFAFPAGLVVLLTVSMTFIGDGLRDALDPTSVTGAAGGRR
ncbi:ABC transporter permease [Streptomyces venezuelae]|uniref:Oligopeptide transport system permease protein OppC n=1 Tax=Streptomyces venezuelae TaxID=54571 RepID=A0A5P2B4D4_STRVZ|nr:ABC transporter permease [Streptomyces venezuelae]MYY86820.1 ABC transporter permease subunit [Streptomyces sp. SID335]MYZ16695.1 ABC transporter permease subunit [Streptomyces sp. SID337]NDZ92175.1 ABC transporter permease [Streptomyces sp. SID10115]NDZ99658.1 ABC transporter permease [Streptomyces sp. SID10116]NEB46034.1 ABC transporter permease [Streptomyces sp. SID339]